MRHLLPLCVVASLAAVPLLACGQSGATSQGSITQQALGIVAKQAWSGTIKITQSASATSSQQDIIHSSTTTQTMSNDVFITVTKGIAAADIKFDAHDDTNIIDHYDGYDVFGKISELTTASGSNRQDASVKVSIYDDGRYEIEYNAGGITGKYTKVQTTETVCKSKNDPNCTDTSSQTSDAASPTKLGFVAGGVNGTLPKLPNGTFDLQPKVLTGIVTEPCDFFSGAAPPGKTTITWNLTR